MIIAERVFDMRGEAVSLTIHMPVAVDENYHCEYIVAWPSGEQRSEGWGVDALPALELTLQKAHLDLLSSTPGRKGDLRFLGSQDLGLPLPEGAKASDFIGREWVEPKREVISVAPFSVASCADSGHCHIVRYDAPNDRIETFRLMADGHTEVFTVVERQVLLDPAGRSQPKVLGETLLMDTDFGRSILASHLDPRRADTPTPTPASSG